jgi:hypothetical protein
MACTPGFTHPDHQVRLGTAGGQILLQQLPPLPLLVLLPARGTQESRGLPHCRGVHACAITCSHAVHLLSSFRVIMVPLRVLGASRPNKYGCRVKAAGRRQEEAQLTSDVGLQSCLNCDNGKHYWTSKATALLRPRCVGSHVGSPKLRYYVSPSLLTLCHAADKHEKQQCPCCCSHDTAYQEYQEIIPR